MSAAFSWMKYGDNCWIIAPQISFRYQMCRYGRDANRVLDFLRWSREVQSTYNIRYRKEREQKIRKISTLISCLWDTTHLWFDLVSAIFLKTKRPRSNSFLPWGCSILWFIGFANVRDLEFTLGIHYHQEVFFIKFEEMHCYKCR